MHKPALIKLFRTTIRFLLVNKFFFLVLRVYDLFIANAIEELSGKVLTSKIKKKGKDLRVHGKIRLISEDRLIIGDYVRIGRNCFFSCRGGLTIGDNAQLSRNITIYTDTHDIDSTAIPYDTNYVYKPVVIGNSVWIGMGVTIAPGTIIEDGAVIGMGATVSGHIPKGAIVVGAKHRIIGYRDIDSFDSKLSNKEYYGLLYPDN